MAGTYRASARLGTWTRSEILGLYKNLLRAAEKMPTQNRIDYVKMKTRKEFKASRGVTDSHQIDLLMVVGLTNLESVEVQAAHLTKVFSTDHVKESYSKSMDRTNSDKATEDVL